MRYCYPWTRNSSFPVLPCELSDEHATIAKSSKCCTSSFEYSGVLYKVLHDTWENSPNQDLRCWLLMQMRITAELVTPHSNLPSTVQGSRCIEIHSTAVCHIREVGNFNWEWWKATKRRDGQESHREILLASRIHQVKEQVSAQDRALMIDMMVRGKIMRNDGWGFPFEWVRISKCRRLRSCSAYFDWKKMFSMLRLLFCCILLYVWSHRAVVSAPIVGNVTYVPS